MPTFIKQHPRMSYLLSGFLMGLIVCGALWYGNRGATDILTSRIQKLEMTLVEEQMQHDQLKTAHKQLKTTFKESFEEIIKPDGTKIVRRITDNTSDSKHSSSSESHLNQSKSSQTTAAQSAETKSVTKDLDLRLDFGTNLTVGLSGYYRFLPPFNLGLGIEIDPKNPSVIKELRLGIGIRF